MPWLDNARCVVQAWYGGNETGNSIADVIFGTTNPGGKLPISFPLRNEDNPAFLNYRSERGKTVYGEGIYIGYRFYEKTKRDVAFPFGHGLSYTTFAFDSLSLSHSDDAKGNAVLNVSVNVTNQGSIAGAQVIQVYVSPQSSSVSHPVKQLKGFTKVFLAPGETVQAQTSIVRKYATSFWDEQMDSWCEERGGYTVLVGASSANTPLQGEFVVDETSFWRGL